MNQDQQTKPAVGTEKLTNWKNEPTLLSLKTDLESAKQAHDEQQQKIDRWNDLSEVKGKFKPPKVKGRSSVQPKLVRRQAEWRYSALSEPFLGTNKLFSVSPVTFEDKAAAEQNELLLNWQFRTKLNKVALVDSYVRSVVDEGTAILRTGWCRKTTTVKEMAPTYEYWAIESSEQEEQLQQAMQLKEENPRQYNETVPEEVKAALDFTIENGTPVYAIQIGEEEVEIEKVLENKPTVDLINPANFYLDPSCQGVMDKALFAVVEFETNKAELMLEPDRYSNLDKINWESASPAVQPNYETKTPQDFYFRDPARKKVVACEYWGWYAVNGGDTLEPFVATWVGDVLIRMELSPFPDKKLPFVLVPYMPVKRSVYGEADAELLEDNQKILGALTRGMVDIMGRSAAGQQGFAKGMLDPLNRRRFEAGQDYDFNPNVTPAVGHIQHTYPEVNQSSLTMLSLQNQDAEALTGVKSFAGGLSGTTYGDVATGIRGVLDAASKREMGILRRLAGGFKEIAIKITSMNAEFLSEEEVVRITNESYVTVYREELAGNFDLIVDISTAEVDDAKAKDLGFMLQTIGPNTDQSIVMMVLAEIARLKQMTELHQMLKNWKPAPDPMKEQMNQLLLQEQQLKNAKLESEIQLNQAKAAEASANKDQKDLDFVEQENGTKHARDVDVVQSQARGNQALEVTKALTKPYKEGERPPNIETAIGYNQISDMLRS